MPQRNVITEYLATISPAYNINQWENAANNIGNKLNNVLGKTLFRGADKQIKELQDKLNKLVSKRDLIQRSLRQTQNRRENLIEQIKNIEGSDKLTEEQKKEKLDPIKKQLSDVENILKKQRSTQQSNVDEINKTTIALQNTNNTITNAGKLVGKASGALGLLITVVNTASETFKDIVDNMSEFSNKFVSQNSIFVDTQTRDIMAKYGVDSVTAQSINAAMSSLGIDLTDYSKLTAAQRKAFDELMLHYQQGLDSIDPDRLDRFNKATQEYQLMQVKFQMDMQLIWMKMLAQSDALPELMETVGDTLGYITDILGSQTFQTGAEILFGIINGILEFATAPIRLFGGLFGGNNTSTTNNTSNTTNNNNFNINNSNGITGQQLALDISMQLQNVTTP